MFVEIEMSDTEIHFSKCHPSDFNGEKECYVINVIPQILKEKKRNYRHVESEL